MSQGLRTRLLYVTLYAAVGAFFPYIPLYYRSLGLNLDVVGLLAALSSVSAMVGAPLWGAAADRFGRSRLVLPVPAVLAAAAFAGLAFARGPWAVSALVAASALAMAGVAPILDARALETVSEDRSRFGRLRVWGSISFIASALLVGWLTDHIGIGALFIVLVGALIATAVVGAGLRSLAIGPALPRLAALTSVLRSPMLMRFMALILVVWSANSAVNAFFSIYLESVGASGTLLGAAWAIGAAVEVPVMFAFSALAWRYGLERLLVVGGALFVVRTLAVVALRDPVLVSLTFLIHGAAFGLTLVGGVAYVSRHAPEGAAASAQGVLSATVFGLAMVIGPGIGGALAKGIGLPGMFAVAAGLSLLGAIGLGWVLGVGDRASAGGVQAPDA